MNHQEKKGATQKIDPVGIVPGSLSDAVYRRTTLERHPSLTSGLQRAPGVFPD